MDSNRDFFISEILRSQENMQVLLTKIIWVVIKIKDTSYRSQNDHNDLDVFLHY